MVPRPLKAFSQTSRHVEIYRRIGAREAVAAYSDLRLDHHARNARAALDTR